MPISPAEMPAKRYELFLCTDIGYFPANFGHISDFIDAIVSETRLPEARAAVPL